MIEPFVIAVPDVALDDLHARLALTCWPTPTSTSGWELGTDATTLRRLVDRWSDGYDWRAHERAMNDLAVLWQLVQCIEVALDLVVAVAAVELVSTTA